MNLIKVALVAAGALVAISCSARNATPADARPDVAPVCAFGASYTFTTSHGLNPRTEAGRLVPPASFSYENRGSFLDGGVSSCQPALPACNTPGVIDVADIEADLANPDVQQALAQSPPVGYGPKNVADNDSVSFTRADGQGFFQGESECTPESAACRATPAGIHELLVDLHALVTQTLTDPTCAGLR